MIYCLNLEIYPTRELIIEEISCRDENDFEWKIARVENGFFVRYFGEPYFKETYFSCDLKSGEHILIRNTNCIFIKNNDFDVFFKVRDVINSGYTDEIWETFQEMFEERFEHDKTILESEIVK
jgi:hypothetical protein